MHKSTYESKLGSRTRIGWSFLLTPMNLRTQECPHKPIKVIHKVKVLSSALMVDQTKAFRAKTNLKHYSLFANHREQLSNTLVNLEK